MRRERMMPTDAGLGRQLRSFDKTFSAFTVIKDVWFPHLLTDREKLQIAERDAGKRVV